MASQKLREHLSSMSDAELEARREELSAERKRLDTTKPRPITKLYGARGPTPDQAARWKAESSTWNRAWRRYLDEYRLLVEISNERFRARREGESLASVAPRVAASLIERDVAALLLEDLLV